MPGQRWQQEAEHPDLQSPDSCEAAYRFLPDMDSERRFWQSNHSGDGPKTGTGFCIGHPGNQRFSDYAYYSNGLVYTWCGCGQG